MDRIFDAYNGNMGAEFMHKTHERLHWICSQVWGSRVLDVGCSQGVVPLILARMGYAVDGIDINPEAIAFAKEQLAKESTDIQSNVTYTAVDFAKFVPPKDRKYDVVTMSEVLEHLVRPQDFVRKAFSILPEAGRLIITVPFGINDDSDHDHRQTFYLTSIYSLLHPLFEIGVVKIFGGWIGLVCRRRAEETKEPPVIPLNLMRQAEEAFFKIERPLRDGTLAVRNQRQKLNAEREKLAESLRTAEQARLEAEAKVAAADATPLRSELADVRGQLSAKENEMHSLQTSLEVERKAASGLQEQISILKAMLQLVSNQKSGMASSANDQRLLEYSQEVRDLRASLDSKSAELVDRAERCGRLAAECESSKALVAAIEVERTNLREALENEAERHRRENASAKEQLTLAETELAEKTRALADAESKYEAETKAHQESLAKIAELGRQLETNVAQSSVQSEQVAAQATRIKELEEELAGERSWEEQHKRECMAIQDRLSEVEDELAAKVKALSAIETKCASEENLRKKFSAEVYNLGKQVAAQTEQVKTQAVELSKARTELAAKTKALFDLERKCAAEEKQRKKFSGDAYNLGKQVAAQAKQIKAQADELSKTQSELAAKAKSLSAAEAKCVAEGKLRKRFSAEAYSLGRQVAAQSEKIKTQADELSKAKAELAAKTKALARVSEFERGLQEEREKRCLIERERDELAKEYDKLKKSKLGRLTLAYWRFKDGHK